MSFLLSGPNNTNGAQNGIRAGKTCMVWTLGPDSAGFNVGLVTAIILATDMS